MLHYIEAKESIFIGDTLICRHHTSGCCFQLKTMVSRSGI